jgi:hypothetical protein
MIEVFAVRAAHYKLSWLFGLAAFATLSVIQTNMFYFGWTIGTVLGMAMFLGLDMYIFKV